MTGEQLYALYTEQLAAVWDPTPHMIIFDRRPSAPVAWAFLTDVERAAWGLLAARVVRIAN